MVFFYWSTNGFLSLPEAEKKNQPIFDKLQAKTSFALCNKVKSQQH
jgi:hypothetical protein